MVSVYGIGESTTFMGGKDSYPSQLQDILNEKNAGRIFEVINRGVPGSNTADIVANLKKDIDFYKPDMIITMIGCNDTANTVIYKDSVGDKCKVLLGDIRIVGVTKFLWVHIQQEAGRLLGKVAQVKISADEKLSWKVRKHPKKAEAYIELGKFLTEQKRFTEAEELFKRAIRIQPKKDWGYEQLAKTFILQGRYKDAEDVFLNSLEKNQKKALAYVSLARFYKSQNRGRDAERILAGGLKEKPDAPEIYKELALYYHENSQLVMAEEILKTCISTGQNDPEIYTQLAFITGSKNALTRWKRCLKKLLILAARESLWLCEIGIWSITNCSGLKQCLRRLHRPIMMTGWF